MVKCGLRDAGSDEGKLYNVGAIVKEIVIGNVFPLV